MLTFDETLDLVMGRKPNPHLGNTPCSNSQICISANLQQVLGKEGSFGAQMESTLCGEDLLDFVRTKFVPGRLAGRRGSPFQVIPFLYLSGYQQAQVFLDTYGEEACIINVGGMQPLRDDGPKYLRIPVQDNGKDSLLSYLPLATSMIHLHVSQGIPTLVHCRGCFHRSPAVVCAYLTSHRELSLNDAMDVIHLARPQAVLQDRLLLDVRTFQIEHHRGIAQPVKHGQCDIHNKKKNKKKKKDKAHLSLVDW